MIASVVKHEKLEALQYTHTAAKIESRELSKDMIITLVYRVPSLDFLLGSGSPRQRNQVAKFQTIEIHTSTPSK